MEITRSGSQPSTKGPEAYFSGNVRIEPLFQPTDPSRVSAGLVSFEPASGLGWVEAMAD
jgi:quercetin dioxygenase-like cupin family protein